MKILSSGEIDNYANDIFCLLKEIPLFYVKEVLELANEEREKEGEIYHIDTSSSEEEEEEGISKFANSESDNESDEDD